MTSLLIPHLEYFWQYLDYWTELNPDFPWVVFKDQKILAREIQERTKRLAQAMLFHGLQKGDILLTILPNCPEFLYTFFAAQQIGLITVTLDMRYREAELRRFMTLTDPKMVVFAPEMKDNSIEKTLSQICGDFDSKIKYISIVDDPKFGEPFHTMIGRDYDMAGELKSAQQQLQRDDGAAIVFTGGTTGKPKAALISHRNIAEMGFHEVSFLFSQIKPGTMQKRPAVYNGLPNSHVGGLIEFNSLCFIGGMQMILDASWHPIHQLEAIQKYQTPFFGGVPTMGAILLSLPNLESYDLSSLQLCLLSGEKLNLEMLKEFQGRICPNIVNGYGSTESGAEIAITTLEDPIEKLAEGYAGQPFGSIFI